MSEPEPISTETIIAVVSDVATQDESDRVFAAALTDADLQARLALSLPPENEDVKIVATVAESGEVHGATGKGLE